MSDITTSVSFSTGETVTAAIMNSIIPSCTIQPSFVSGKPLVSTLANNDALFGVSAGNSLQQILFSSLQAQVLSGAVGAGQSGVSNLIMNGDGLINQRALSPSIAATGYTELDRWKMTLLGASAGRATVAQDVPTTLATLPFVTGGPTSYSDIKITVPSATSTIAAGDAQFMSQFIENNLVEPISNGPISISFIYKTNFSGIVTVFLRDFGQVHSYVVPVTLTGDSAWHLVTIQNILSLGAQTLQFGVYGGYSIDIGICLLSGATFQTGTTGSWVAGNFVAANTQGNFFASAANVLQIAQFMVNPGATTVPYYSEPFTQQLLKCQRYYGKTYPFGTKPGANIGATGAGSFPSLVAVGFLSNLIANFKFPAIMRAAPTPVMYSPTGGAIGNIFDVTAGTNRTCAAGLIASDSQFTQGNLGTASVAGNLLTYAGTFDADF